MKKQTIDGCTEETSGNCWYAKTQASIMTTKRASRVRNGKAKRAPLFEWKIDTTTGSCWTKKLFFSLRHFGHFFT